MTNRSIDELCADLERKRAQAREGGGPKSIEKQRGQRQGYRT